MFYTASLNWKTYQWHIIIRLFLFHLPLRLPGCLRKIKFIYHQINDLLRPRICFYGHLDIFKSFIKNGFTWFIIPIKLVLFNYYIMSLAITYSIIWPNLSSQYYSRVCKYFPRTYRLVYIFLPWHQPCHTIRNAVVEILFVMTLSILFINSCIKLNNLTKCKLKSNGENGGQLFRNTSSRDSHRMNNIE